MSSVSLRRIIVPFRLESMRKELSLYAAWFNECRPHQGLEGLTPREVYEGGTPANALSRFEPRARWSKRSACAAPQTNVKGKAGVRVACVISLLGGRRHLPIVELKDAA